ncbi:helix-turn-helix domain-containing protein [Micrococcus lylae]|uniref:helix-turn-helix domain-containing protein n=1 Tax=Micrococcus lylae TaxID=1273 RepID=UPI000B1079DF|nr:AraC family transcriptional regulator [Micrococcus lylae]
MTVPEADTRSLTRFTPVLARTTTAHATLEPVAYDCVKVIVVRAGGALLFSEFGVQHVNVGDVIVLAANTLCGAEPEDWVTTTTLYLDRDYVVDQVFWQYAEQFTDRLDAMQFLDARYAEPAQVVRLGEGRAGLLMPWLDELAVLSADGLPPDRFYRAQALLFAVLDVIMPRIAVTAHRLTASQRCAACPSLPRHRQFEPLREEARHAAHLLRGELARRWTLRALAEEVHLSRSQLGRVFVEAFGKSPIAYLAMLRVERMAHLLRTTDTPISVIANQVGWGDADFAARQFRRSVGVPPSRYRAMGRASTSG